MQKAITLALLIVASFALFAAPASATNRDAVSTNTPDWRCIKWHESGSSGGYRADTGDGYYGAYQFSLSAWEGLGFTGLPSNASPAVQNHAALMAYRWAGRYEGNPWQPWPESSALCGL